MPRRAERALAALALAAALGGAGCAAGRGAPGRGSEPRSGTTTSFARIASAPEAYRGGATQVAGWIVAGGSSPEGTWLALSDSAPAAGAGRAPVAGARPAPTTGDLVLLIDTTVAPGSFDGVAGRPVEMLLEVHGSTTLSDGRAAVRALPIELVVSEPTGAAGGSAGGGEQASAPTAAERAAITAAVKSTMQRRAQDTRTFFADPAMPASSSRPEVRYACQDSGRAGPRFHLQGPVIVERTGSDAAPTYRFVTSLAADDGAVRQSECRFHVADGTLRSDGLDERIVDADGTVHDEQHLDFRSGSYLEKSTGARGPWPANIYPSPCLGFVLGGLPLGDAAMVRFSLWSEYDAATPMFAAVEAREPLQTSAGTFDTYRVRMNVDDDRVIGKLALPSAQGYAIARDMLAQMRPPDTIMWLTAAAPHVVVRTVTVPGPPGTASCTIEPATVDARVARLGAQEPPR